MIIYLFILHAWFQSYLQCFRLPSILHIATLLAFLCLELLEHAGPQLLSHHLVLTVALPFALSRFDDIFVSCNLQVGSSAALDIG